MYKNITVNNTYDITKVVGHRDDDSIDDNKNKDDAHTISEAIHKNSFHVV